jgi:hypothetical protein
VVEESHNLIIPMAGFGSRFKKAGYKTYKPFIKINGKCMIDYVIDNFPSNVNKFFLVNKNLLTDCEVEYLSNKKNGTIVEINPHQNGPGFSIVEAKDKLPLNESFFIAYNDIYWDWNFDDVRNKLEDEGIIFVNHGFHPHLIKKSFSGFCLAEKSKPMLLKDLNVKGNFTENWMYEEYLDTALYFCKSGYNMISLLEEEIECNRRIAGEYFVPSIYKKMLSYDKKIILHEVNFFIHWGIPNHLEDFLLWHNAFRSNDIEFLDTFKQSNDKNKRMTYEFWNKNINNLFTPNSNSN